MSRHGAGPNTAFVATGRATLVHHRLQSTHLLWRCAAEGADGSLQPAHPLALVKPRRSDKLVRLPGAHQERLVACIVILASLIHLGFCQGLDAQEGQRRVQRDARGLHAGDLMCVCVWGGGMGVV